MNYQTTKWIRDVREIPKFISLVAPPSATTRVMKKLNTQYKKRCRKIIKTICKKTRNNKNSYFLNMYGLPYFLSPVYVYSYILKYTSLNKKIVNRLIENEKIIIDMSKLKCLIAYDGDKILISQNKSIVYLWNGYYSQYELWVIIDCNECKDKFIKYLAKEIDIKELMNSAEIKTATRSYMHMDMLIVDDVCREYTKPKDMYDIVAKKIDDTFEQPKEKVLKLLSSIDFLEIKQAKCLNEE